MAFVALASDMWGAHCTPSYPPGPRTMGTVPSIIADHRRLLHAARARHVGVRPNLLTAHAWNARHDRIGVTKMATAQPAKCQHQSLCAR